jgi:hypothetical protein
MVRLLLGLVKGAVIGAGVGFGAHVLGLGTGWNFMVYGAIGLLVGLLVGRPFWSHLFDPKSTIWTGVLKGIFGFGIGVGMWALGTKALPQFHLDAVDASRPLSQVPQVAGGIIGILYGIWVELDDPPVKRDKQDKDKQDKQQSAKKKK